MPTRKQQLHLHEELLLLAMHDERGTFHSQATMCTYAIAGAIITELVFAERIEIEDDKKKLVNVLDARPMRDPVLDDVITRMNNARRRARVSSWVSRVAQMSKLPHRIAEGLCRQGVLREEEGRILWLFRRRLFPERDGRVERLLIERMRKAIFSSSQTVAPRTAVLIALADGADLLKIPFDRKELRSRKERIRQITEGELMGRVTRDVIRAAQAAVTAAITAATTVAVTTATS